MGMQGLRGRRVLFVVPRFHTNLFFATKALVHAGVHVSLFANASSEGEDHSFVKPIVLGATADTKILSNALNKAAPDLILLRDAARLSEQVARAAKRRGIPMLAYNLKPMTQKRSIKDLLRRRWRGLPIDRVTPVPGLSFRGWRDPRAYYLPWPVGRDPQARPSFKESAKLRILCVGKLMQPRKNQDLLIRAIQDADLTEQVQLMLVGSTTPRARGAEERHFKMLRHAASAGWIELYSDQPFDKMPQFYASTDICVLPAAREPLGYAPVEAMAYGVIPIISTQCGSAGYITHGRDGFRFDSAQPQDLGQILINLATNPRMRKSVSENAKRTADQCLSMEKFLLRFATLLEKTCQKPRH